MSDPFVSPYFGPWDPNIKRLAAAHPILFRNRPPRIWSDLASGWYSAVDQLCTRIETTLPADELPNLKFKQLKEKFGTLRIHIEYRGSYDSPTWNTVRALIDAAQEAADRSCQDCGAQAELRQHGGWYLTLCDQHFAERISK
ncbi:hypothetical protein J7U46_19260 [Pelomonas sp. V22]|uniref:hypothetical protein n=1 Tax=Pelomonas sp. V22 TaxID=2822139 RepID=UPI0024A7F93B|nr:hypothetical protein [Pelomonas sp. V22]MDI4635210.1 hypothetical protein [Pelomonas sp. V22]